MTETVKENSLHQKKENVEEIWGTLEEKHNKKPKLVLSIVGDSETFVPKVWSRDMFQTALIEAAKYSGGDTWILFRGRRNSSVSLMISDSFDTYTHLQNLHSNPTEDSFPIKPISLSFVGDTKENKKLKKLKGHHECTLPVGKEEFEEFRLELESHIHHQKVSFLDDADLEQELPILVLPIPVVRILVEGDLNSIQDIAKSVNKDLPVVIIKGSGKAADLIVDYIESPESLKSNAALLFGIRFRNVVFNKLKESLEQIKACEHLINIFDVENDNAGSFLQVIGEAVVRASAYSHFTNEGERQDTSSSGEPIACVTENSANVQIKKKQFQKYLSTSDCIKQSDAMPASVPLFFYFGYQFLQHRRKLLKYGHILLYQALRRNRCDYVNALVSDGVKFKATYLAKLYFKTFTVSTTTSCYMQDWEHLIKITIAPNFILCVTEKINFKPEDPEKDKKKRSIEEQKVDHFYEVSGAVKSLCCYFLQYNAEIKKRDQIKVTDPQSSKLKAKRSTEASIETPDENGDTAEGKPETKTSKDADAPGPSKKDTDPSGSKPEGDQSAKEDVGTSGPSQDERQPGKKSDAVKIKKEKTVFPSLDDVNKNVLLWAIFAQREEIAELFWLHGDNHLVSSLICTVLLRKLSEKAEDSNEHNLSRRFGNHARLFEERVYMLLDFMYEEDEKCAMETMDEKSTVFGVKTTPLTFAYENLLYDVIAHPCSQRHMDRDWHTRRTKGQEEKNNDDECRFNFIKPSCSNPNPCPFSPKTCYILNYVLFFGALVSYSGFVLTSVGYTTYTRETARFMEYSVYFWGFGDFLEEYRPLKDIFLDFFCGGKCRRFLFQLKLHVNNFWNFMDVLSYISIVVALCVRHAGDQEDFTWSRRVFSFSLLIMYLRFLQAFLMTRTFGVTLIMIKEMLKDLLAFIWLAVFVIAGVGMYYHANLWPDHLNIFDGSVETWRIWRIISLPYWQLYGEPNNDYLMGKDLSNCTNDKSVWLSDPTQERCPKEDWTVMLIAAFFMLFSNLLLVNLVIAKFSYTFAKVQANSERLWMFERYVIIKDFKNRIPSPFNLFCLICYVYGCGSQMVRKIQNRIQSDESQPESVKTDKEKERQERRAFLIKFQKVMATRVINKQRKKRRNKNHCHACDSCL